MFRVILAIAASLVSVQGIWNGELEDIANGNAHTAAILRRHWDTGIFEHYCTGAIISELYILTTAYCSGNVSGDIRIRVGSSYHNTGGQIYEVANVYQHPKFSPDFDYDIALLKLYNATMLNHHVAIVDLPPQDATLLEGREVKVGGWGYYKWEESPHKHFTAGYLNINTERCKSYYYDFTGRNVITDNMMCADGDTRPCERDQGAPLIFMRRLYGLFSWHFGCFLSTSSPVFTRVSVFRTWIDNYLLNNQ